MEASALTYAMNDAKTLIGKRAIAIVQGKALRGVIANVMGSGGLSHVCVLEYEAGKFVKCPWGNVSFVYEKDVK